MKHETHLLRDSQMHACDGSVDAPGGVWQVTQTNCSIPFSVEVGREARPTGVWETRRAGPFVTSGGMFVKLRFGLGLRELCFGAYEIALVDAGGAVVEYPPLHPHHVRVEGASKFQVAESFNADSVDYKGSHAGDYGGYAMRVAAPHVAALVHDVRASGAAAFEWHLACRFFVNDSSLPEASLFITGHVASPRSFDALHVPAHRTSVFVYGGAFPISGRLIAQSSRLHTHSSYDLQSGVLLHGAKPAVFAPMRDGTAYPLRAFQASDSVALMREHLRGAATVVCEANGTSVRIGGRYYGQRPTLRCREWVFVAGGLYTAVNFVVPVHEPIPFEVAEVHSEWMLRYVASNGTRMQYRKYDALLGEVRSAGLAWWLAPSAVAVALAARKRPRQL